ncbi:MAG TPA: zf-HC2 domain-containing protein, partial [Ktedonobacteraceae bacterium]
MNCRQAREMLAAYRDLKNEQTDTTELEIHLATCADCRQQLDQYNLLGRRIRALPRIDATSGTYTRLMQALAKEHALYLQHNTASTQARSVPEFLVPYLQQQTTPHKDALTAFSTAKTGPLPVITL